MSRLLQLVASVFILFTPQLFASAAVNLSKSSLSFGVQLIETASSAQSISLKNSGSDPLAISSIAITGDFIRSTTCGGVLPTGESCVISVAFRPTAVGTRSGTLTIADNASNSPQSVALTGTGTEVSLSPRTLSYPARVLGTTSNYQSVTVQNHGTSTMSFSAISITGVNAGDYFISYKTCGASLGAGAGCVVHVKFKPMAVGTRAATLNFYDNGGGSPQRVKLTGIGVVSLSGCFPSASSFSVATRLGSIVAAGDFNGDGRSDVATANSDGTISILLGEADGSLRLLKNFPLPYYYGTPEPTSIRAADLNGDGKLDLAVISNDGISVFLGDGTGNFAPLGGYINMPVQASDIVVSDFNRDGKADLVVALPGDDTVSVLLGNGDGTFKTPSSFATGTPAQFLTIADFNHDGKLDLAGAGSPNQVTILLGNGDGTFQPAKALSAGSNVRSIVSGDFNGDHNADLAVTNANGGVTLLLGNGDGTFKPGANFGGQMNLGAAAVSDFNGDGRSDLVALSNGGISIFLGEASGTLAAPTSFAAATSPGEYPPSLVVGDFNGDGKTDLAMPDRLSGISVLLGAGGGSFVASRLYPTGNEPFAAAEGDFNGDGKPDLAIANDASNDVSIFVQSGNGIFKPASEIGVGQGPDSIVTGDFDGDGKTDLAVTNYRDSTIMLLRGNGDGSFQAPVIFATPPNPRSLIAADLNGDGHLDFVVTSGSNVAVLLGDGLGGFGTPISSTAGLNPSNVVTGDFNRDGNLDLAMIVNNPNTSQGQYELAILEGKGDGTFTSPSSFVLTSTPISLVAGDFNHDGYVDLVVSNTDGSLNILLGNGDGTFAETTTGIGIYGPMAAADFNNDGKLDLAISGASILYGNGDGSFQTAHSYFSVDYDYVGYLLVVDLNADGKPDLAVIDYVNNNVAIMTNGPCMQ